MMRSIYFLLLLGSYTFLQYFEAFASTKNKKLENLIIAHRGASYYAPESTTAAYSIAKLLGADYLEADIQRTKDGVLIVFHDATLQRTTNVSVIYFKRKNALIKDFTLAELKGLDTGSWFNERFSQKARKEFSSMKILTLDEFLTIAKGFGIYLETKNAFWYSGIEKEIYLLLKKRHWLDKNIILQTFDTTSLILLNKYMPKISKCLLLEKKDLDYPNYVNKIKWAKENQVSYIGVPLDSYSPIVAKNIKKFDLRIHIFTVNNFTKVKYIEHISKEDGIFTDIPDLKVITK